MPAGVEKPGDQFGRLGWAFQDEQVAAAPDDLEARRRNAMGQYPAVDERNDRVVAPTSTRVG